MALPSELSHFLASVHPYDTLTDAAFAPLSQACTLQTFDAGQTIFDVGDTVEALYIIAEGDVEVLDDTGTPLSLLGPRNSFGERALLNGGTATRTASALSPVRLIALPAVHFQTLIDSHAAARRFFDRGRSTPEHTTSFATLSVDSVMTKAPLSCAATDSIHTAARLMAEHRISSVCVEDNGDFTGIVTLRDLNRSVIVAGQPKEAPVNSIMTKAPMTLPPQALVTDVLHLMVERQIGHVPIVADKTLVGIVTQTDLTRAQALSSAEIVRQVATAPTATDMAAATARIPDLLVQLVDAGNRHEVITRLITDIADAATRRLLALAEAKLGPPPVPYLWLACGSQGRQEQAGVSDQDNCLILSDEVTNDDMGYFTALATEVCAGLNECGYVFCPGEMMAQTPRWCQPLAVWQGYFNQWIATPNPEAQMLASVMFDLRPIGGDHSLFDALQGDVLERAARNSIFTAHMVSNSLKHHPPLGLLRGLATIRSGEHRNALDLKHNGVVPVVDLGRIYALTGQLRPTNTRARIEAAIAAGAVSPAGGADLLDAYDLIAETRLYHQARQIRAGHAPTNFLDPADLSDFERSHLRDAFVVVKTMQSAAGSGKGALG